MPSVRHHLNSRIFEDISLLFLDHCKANPPAAALKSQDEKVRLIFLPKDITTLLQLMDPGIIGHSNSCCGMLRGVVNSELQIMEFLKTVMLKNVEYIVDLTFRIVIPATI
jgi:hypothetical protein